MSKASAVLTDTSTPDGASATEAREAELAARYQHLCHWRDLAHERLISAAAFNAKLTSRVSRATQNELWSTIVAAVENYYEATLAVQAFEKGCTVSDMDALTSGTASLPL